MKKLLIIDLNMYSKRQQNKLFSILDDINLPPKYAQEVEEFPLVYDIFTSD